MSIDDVMKLVDTEEGDILLLTELTRDESQLSELSEAIRSDISRDSSVNQLVISKSFDSNFNPPQQIDSSYLSSYFSTSKPLPRQLQSQRLSGCPSTVPIPLSFDLETIEEIEDLLLLSRSGCYNADPTVHFRSRYATNNVSPPTKGPSYLEKRVKRVNCDTAWRGIRSNFLFQA